jgi:hypothetical protein
MPNYRRILFSPRAGALPTPSNLQVWLKADAIIGLNDGDPISTWPESSGHARDYTGTTTTRPLYKTAQQNSLPGVVFDGTDDFMTGTGASALSFSFYTVFKFASTAGTPVPMHFGVDNTFGTTDGFMIILVGGNRCIQERASAAAVTLVDAAATTNFEQWTINRTNTGPVTALRVNQSDQSLTNSSAAMTSNTMGIIGKFGSFGLPASCTICEILYYDTIHTTAQRDQVESYLKSKWGL